jgi:sugar fermentation stimulation protein A
LTELLAFRGLVKGTFLSRENRFLGTAEVDGRERRIHIHDPGRLEELLIAGAPVLLLPKRGFQLQRFP